MGVRFIDREEVRRRLTYGAAIALVRQAMIAFSAGRTRQLLRGVIPLAEGRMFGVMPGALGEAAAFGAKLISVFPDNFARGAPSHQGVIVLFDPESGAPACVVDAGEVTAIRTAAASAVATEALARPEAASLALLGYGEQAAAHVRALRLVRPIARVAVWGRSPKRAAAFAERMAAELALPFTAAASVAQAVSEADIVCAVTAASEPILEAVDPGTHVNLVGAGHAGQAEASVALVVAGRFIADSREGVLAQGGEFLRAKAVGAVGDDHIAAEIGEVLAGTRRGRSGRREITLYKSLGHVVQDLACAQALFTGVGLEA
jgi:ornithine cyclodeaminase